MKVWLAGEGTNDIGSLAKDAQTTHEYPGALHELLRLSCPDAEVIGGSEWRSVPKLRTGSKGAGAEAQTVAGLQLRAEEKNADALVFMRDRDGDRDRQTQIESALANSTFPTAGVVSVETLEHWICAVSGRSKSERLSGSQVDARLAQLKVKKKSTQSYVAWLSSRSLQKLPQDAKSLRMWIQRLGALT